MSVSALTSAALQHKKAQGERTGGAGKEPFGFRTAADGIHLEPHPEEQAVLAKVRALRAAGVSIRGIAAQLNNNKAPARGVRWHATTVANVLKRSSAPEAP